MTALDAFKITAKNEIDNSEKVLKLIYDSIGTTAKNGKWSCTVDLNYQKDIVKQVRKELHTNGFHTVYNQMMGDKMLIIDWKKNYEDEV